MKPAYRSFAALACLAGLTLSGCAAVALPVLAGGAIVRSTTDGIDADLSRASTPDQSPAPQAAASSTPSHTRYHDPEEKDAFALFFAYAKGWNGQKTAALRQPAALDGVRKECRNTAPSVLIDLDPAGSVFAPGMALSRRKELAANLAELRKRNISVAWISAASAAYAGDVRLALKNSGLDPASSDALLMMRYHTDRKQTRRNDLAEAMCLIAIAGDERADFDELYKHLINPEAAYTLERIVGNGWFLVPSLIIATPNAPAAPDTLLVATMEETKE